MVYPITTNIWFGINQMIWSLKIASYDEFCFFSLGLGSVSLPSEGMLGGGKNLLTTNGRFILS
jgi:hypothetical protein